MMIKWIFFDVGNVILNDDPAMAMLYKLLSDKINQNGSSVPLFELFKVREKSVSEHRDGMHYKRVALKFLGEKKWKKQCTSIMKELSNNWEQLSPLMPDIVPVIKTLHHNYQLGLIANQPKEVMPVLEKHNLLHYFSVHAISHLIGKSKPDPAIFKYAFERANCMPHESIMIGDRIDNDVAPAKQFGMHTIWLSLDLTKKNYTPQTDYEMMYFESIRRASASLMLPRNPSEQPDYIAESFDQLIDAVSFIEANYSRRNYHNEKQNT